MVLKAKNEDVKDHPVIESLLEHRNVGIIYMQALTKHLTCMSNMWDLLYKQCLNV